MSGKNILIILLAITTIGLAGFVCYDKVLKKEEKVNLNSEKKLDNNKNEIIKDLENDDLTLFNKEVTDEDLCPNRSCDKNLGKFSLGNNIYDASIKSRSYNDEVINNPYSSLKLGNIIIKFDEGFASGEYLSRISKLSDKYLLVEINDAASNGYSNTYDIYVYDEELSILKIIPDTYRYFNDAKGFQVKDNTFIYYKCNTDEVTKENDFDSSKQKVDMYKVTINDRSVSETYVSSKYEVCTSLDTLD